MTEQQPISDIRKNVSAWPGKDRGSVAIREKAALELAGVSLLLTARVSPTQLCVLLNRPSPPRRCLSRWMEVRCR